MNRESVLYSIFFYNFLYVCLRYDYVFNSFKMVVLHFTTQNQKTSCFEAHGDEKVSFSHNLWTGNLFSILFHPPTFFKHVWGVTKFSSHSERRFAISLPQKKLVVLKLKEMKKWVFWITCELWICFAFHLFQLLFIGYFEIWLSFQVIQNSSLPFHPSKPKN